MSFTLTGAELASIILALATLVAAVSAALSAGRASGKIDRVGSALNGQTQHLVALTAASSYAVGAASRDTIVSAPVPGVGGVVGAPPADPSHVGNNPTSV